MPAGGETSTIAFSWLARGFDSLHKPWPRVRESRVLLGNEVLRGITFSLLIDEACVLEIHLVPFPSRIGILYKAGFLVWCIIHSIENHVTPRCSIPIRVSCSDNAIRCFVDASHHTNHVDHVTIQVSSPTYTVFQIHARLDPRL